MSLKVINEAFDKQLKSNELEEVVDLSKVEGNMTKILCDNSHLIRTTTSSQELYELVKNLFEQHNIKNSASEKMLRILPKLSFAKALQYVYDSILKGSGLGVI